MSHVAKIELEIRDLSVLKAACKRLGVEFIEGKENYAWYGHHVGDYPVPEGFSISDMGKCHHAIKVPGATYEIGVVKQGLKYTLLWDFYSSGGLTRVIGENAGKLKQAYAVELAVSAAQKKGFMVSEQKTKTGIRLTLQGR